MKLPEALYFELVYTCDGEETHEFRDGAITRTEIDDHTYEDADPCQICKHDYKEYSRVTLDRIEIADPTE